MNDVFGPTRVTADGIVHIVAVTVDECRSLCGIDLPANDQASPTEGCADCVRVDTTNAVADPMRQSKQLRP